MAKLCVRIMGTIMGTITGAITSALGVTALALLFLSLVPFLSVAPTAGAAYVPRTPAFTVNREFKGDRLPIHAPLDPSVWRTEFGSLAHARAPHEIPFACEPSFSPISSPRLANIYGRCLS